MTTQASAQLSSPDTSALLQEASIYSRAEQHIAAGEMDTACGLLIQLVEAGSLDWQPYNDLGVIALNQNDVPTAIHFLHEAAQRETTTDVASTNLIAALLMNGRSTEAATAWGQSIGRNGLGNRAAALADFLFTHGQDREILPTFLEALKHVWLDSAQTASKAPNHLALQPQFLPIVRLGSFPHVREVFPQETLPRVTAEFFFAHTTPTAALTFPAIKQYEIANAQVRPFSDVVQQDAAVIVPDFFELGHHMLYDTFSGHVVPLPGQNMAAVRSTTVTQHLPSGVALTSYAVSNWSHFLTEILPIVAMTERVGIPLDVPLVLSEGILPQMLQLIGIVKAPQRRVVLIRGTTRIEQATVFSPVTTVTYDYIDTVGNRPPRFSPQDTLFSATALRLTTSQLLPHDPLKHKSDTKIFIDRQSSVRRMRNKAEVLQFFMQHGYRVVVPESLSAQEQLELFSGASVIAGQAGAGMANMMLAPSGCRVIVLSPATSYGAYGYFPNMAACLGHQLYAFGFEPLPGNYHSPAHVDFEVDIAMLAAKLALIT